MSRVLSVEPKIRIGQEEVVVDVGHAQVEVWALELTLLLNGLSESLTVRSGPTNINLSLLEERGAREVRTVVSRVRPARFKFSISRTQAKSFQAFLLRAYRDGMAEANHVHIEGYLGTTEFDLTFLFQRSMPPMSPAEAAKLMGEE